MISICVPTWNSLAYLKILYASLKRNTKLKYELIVHDNGSTDQTLEWLKEHSDIVFTRSEENEGFTGVNHALRLAKYPYTMIMNTDMYVLPLWDVEIFKQINKFKSQKVDKFSISCSLIEPMGNNPEYVISYHGHDDKTFDEQGLLLEYLTNRDTKYNKENTIQYSHPILMPSEMFKQMGYLDTSYFPGWAVDHDLAAEAYKLGCRSFIMLSSSRVYHFISKTFTKLPKDVKSRHGEDVFEKKQGISVKRFRQELGIAQPYKGVKDGIV
jgi:GT2 family glycosyltransferase